MSVPYFEKSGGLRFECTRCGDCCTRPGPVYFPPTDLARAARFLGISERAFVSRYRLRRLDGVLALDPPDGTPCPFHREETGCAIYEGRPTQCRTFPFWPEIIRGRRSWERAGRECEGIGRGPVHPPAEIRRQLDLIEELELPEGDDW